MRRIVGAGRLRIGLFRLLQPGEFMRYGILNNLQTRLRGLYFSFKQQFIFLSKAAASW